MTISWPHVCGAVVIGLAVYFSTIAVARLFNKARP